MKRVLNGKIYDTDKSVELCEIWRGEGSRDFRHMDCKLYVTPRSHSFFLAGYGGPMTVFAKTVSDNTTTGSEGIIPITEDAARTFCEQEEVDVETMSKYFKLEEA